MARYQDAVEWIARNDEPAETDCSRVSELVSVVLVADCWKKLPEQVAYDVLKERQWPKHMRITK